MTMSKPDIAVAVYDAHTKAEDAVKTLQRAGFDMTKISIIGRGYHTEEHIVGFLNAGDRAKVFGKFGAFWGGLMGVLFGSAMMFIPVVGHLIVLGPLAAALVGGPGGSRRGRWHQRAGRCVDGSRDSQGLRAALRNRVEG